MHNRISLGTLIGLPLLILTIIFFLCFGMWLLKKSTRVNNREDSRIVWWVGIASFVTAFCFVVGTLWGMYPYSGEYHQWRQTTGVVQQIDSRLISAGDKGGTDQRFVVTFTDGRQRACDDTRCAQVHEQDELTLYCKRAWQWTGTPGYDCTYGEVHSPRND